MTKVVCADVSCAYCNDKSVCTRKEIGLSWHSVNTLWEGRKEFNRCSGYVESEDSKLVRKVLGKHPFPGDRSIFK